MTDRQRVLIKEKIADSGVDLLKAKYDVEIGVDWDRDKLERRIGEFDALLVRSATQVDAALIGKADRMKVIGRAGVGVDNIEMSAATKRGIIVANAPESNIVTAAEHTIALMMAMCRNIPQAHSALKDGRWERSKYSGIEVWEKTLGVIGFGRIGQLVAERAKGMGMHVIGYDPYVGASRYRDLGVEKADSSEDLYAKADIITIHLPKTPETENWLDAEAFDKMREGVRVINCARGPLLNLDDLVAALESGKVAGAALDVFPDEPFTEHPIFEHDNVVVTPHLGASTQEAQDRAGTMTAEQIDAALSGGVVSNAVNIPAIRPEDMAVLGPFVPLAQKLGRLAVALGEASSIDKVEVEFRGRLADLDTRFLAIAVLNGVLQGHTEEEVNFVNAPSMAEERGIEVSETKDASAEDFTELIRVAIICGGERIEVAGTGLGPKNLPRLVSVFNQDFNIELADHMAIFRYVDQPGMIGRVGTVFGEHGVNIDQAAVGAGGTGGEAVMIVTAPSPVPQTLIDAIKQLDGFHDGRAVSP